ncbi:hypothetical protein WAF17_08125 [Bernardetia sp. ABR2-2B]|uniref:hypothetical protein n=1 Tax=Bernardetia sp. ABR2-2B TaxID=3127472 RepID=UPI0030CF7716
MIELTDAKLIQAKYLEGLSRNYKQKIISHSLKEHSFGWSFSYNTEDSVRNPKNRLVGVQPIIINRWTGQTACLDLMFYERVAGVTLEDKFYENYPSFKKYKSDSDGAPPLHVVFQKNSSC